MAVAAAELPPLTVSPAPRVRAIPRPVPAAARHAGATAVAAPGVRPVSAAVLRRRRAVLAAATALAVVLVAVGIVALWPSPSIAEQVAEPAPTVVVVGEGDTVWDVVAPHVPAGTDRRAFVEEVVAANDVDAGAIQPGTALALP